MTIKVYFNHRVAWLGGNSNNGAIDGGFARNFNNDASNANWNRRCRELYWFVIYSFVQGYVSEVNLALVWANTLRDLKDSRHPNKSEINSVVP